MTVVKRQSCVSASALTLPIFERLKSKRVVLASSSPRRKDILALVGFHPEIIPSTFEENLPKELFSNCLGDYPALEVYGRLISQGASADLVISGDTVVIFPPEADARAAGIKAKIFEKLKNPDEQLRSLQGMNGKFCEVVTGVTIVYPIAEAPGFNVKTIRVSTRIKFNDNSNELLKAYVDSGEEHDRAGGLSSRGIGGLLVEGIDGDMNNAAGFPLSQFWRWMSDLEAEGVFDPNLKGQQLTKL